MENEKVIATQCLSAMRAVQGEDIDGSPLWRIDCSVLGESTHSFTFSDEDQAKGAYLVLENFYLEALKKIQEKMVEIHDDLTPAPEYDPQIPTKES